MRGAVFHLLLIERPLEKGLLSEIILLLPKMRGDVGYRRRNAESLMKGCLDGHGVKSGTSSAESTTVLLLSPPVRLLFMPLMEVVEWLRVYLQGVMTDVCSTNSTWKELGLV